jgi:3-isopropylmalate dehydratase/3-isopropylmalate/(R)-2-methylmalate dehydratase small subunit
MEAFTRLDAKLAPLPLANIDTDQIIPKQFLKIVDREGLAKGLFYDLRFDGEGREKPDFTLNRQEFKGAGVLVAGDNFGCGSSREHAAWALMDFGVRCVISTSFADIFYNNCFQNGLLPVVLQADEVQQLMDEAKGGNHVASIDLAAQTVVSPSGATFHFEIDPQRKEKMLKGLDAIGETLMKVDAIDVYEMKRALSQPWLEDA